MGAASKGVADRYRVSVTVDSHTWDGPSPWIPVEPSRSCRGDNLHWWRRATAYFRTDTRADSSRAPLAVTPEQVLTNGEPPLAQERSARPPMTRTRPRRWPPYCSLP